MIIEPRVGAVVSVLFKRKRIAVLTTLGFASLGAAYLLIVTPKYRSEAAVVVRFDQAAVPNTDMARESTPEVTAANDRREIVEAHSDILSNPDLARAVIESVGLKVAYPKIAANPPSTGTPMDAAVYRFENSLTADPEIAGDVINVTFLHPDPKLAQTMLSKLLELYMRQEAQLFSASDFAFERVETDQAANRLAAAQQELRAYKERFHISSFDDQVSALIKQRADLSANFQSTQVALGQATQRRDELTHLLVSVPKVMNNAATEKYHSYDDAMTNLSALEQKQKEMEVTYRADSPLMAQLRASISTAQADAARRRSDLAVRDGSTPNLVYQNIDTDLLRATADVKSYTQSVTVQTAQLQSLDSQLSELEAARSGFDDRLRAVQVADGAYRSLALHLEDARVAEGKLHGGISHGAVLTVPSLPYKIAKPRYLIFSVAFALGSILAGLAASIGLELMDDRVTSPAHVMHAFHLPVLATLEEHS